MKGGRLPRGFRAKKVEVHDHDSAAMRRVTAALRRVVNSGQRMSSLAMRVRFAGIVRRYIDGVGPCLKPVGPSNVGLFRGDEPVVMFGSSLGAGSYGEAYVNIGARGAGRLLQFASKLSPSSQSHETKILEKMSHLAERGLSPNMPITFITMTCSAGFHLHPNFQEVTQSGPYNTMISELADGDLFKLFKDQGKTKMEIGLFESVFMQCLLALRAFHGLHLEHNDAHLGNFLFHRIPPGGFWRYDIAGTASGPRVPLFVRNCGILVVLWDPGMAKPIRGEGAEPGNLEGGGDYFKVLNSFLDLGYKGRNARLTKKDQGKANLLGVYKALMQAVGVRENSSRHTPIRPEPFGHTLLHTVLAGIRDGSWLSTIRVGSSSRLSGRTLAPSPLPSNFVLLNAKPFRLDSIRSPRSKHRTIPKTPQFSRGRRRSPPPLVRSRKIKRRALLKTSERE